MAVGKTGFIAGVSRASAPTTAYSGSVVVVSVAQRSFLDGGARRCSVRLRVHRTVSSEPLSTGTLALSRLLGSRVLGACQVVDSGLLDGSLPPSNPALRHNRPSLPSPFTGLLPPKELLATSKDMDLIYGGVKYRLKCSQTGPRSFATSTKTSKGGVGENFVEAQCRPLADGGYLLVIGGKSQVSPSTVSSADGFIWQHRTPVLLEHVPDNPGSTG